MMPTVYEHNERTARKPHRCYECGTMIRPGEKYIYHHGVWDGQGASYRHCVNCYALWIRIVAGSDWMQQEGIAFGGLGEAAREEGFGVEWKKICVEAREVR